MSEAVPQIDRQIFAQLTRPSECASVITIFRDGIDIWKLSDRPVNSGPGADVKVNQGLDITRDFPTGEEWRVYDCPWVNPLGTSDGTTVASIEARGRGEKRPAPLYDLVAEVATDSDDH